jgi:CHAT domain-containing protein
VAIATAPLAAAQESTNLAPGKALERELAGGETHLYQLALPAGDYAGLVVEQRGIDVAVQVLDTAGRVSIEFDSESRKHGREVVGLVADTPVNFQLRIQARYPKDAAAQYTIRVAELRPATERDRSGFEAHRLGTQAQQLDDAGRYDDAVSVVQRAIAVSEQAFGPGDAYIGSLLTRLGSLKRKRADYAGAEEAYLRAIAVSESALGREDPQTAIALRLLGMLYVYTNDYARAEPLLNAQLAILEKTLGPEDPNLITSLSYLSFLYQERKDLERALSFRLRGMAIAEKTLDADDVTFIGTVANLGDLYSLMHDNQRAAPLLERALQLIEKKYGPEHPLVAVPLGNLGIVERENRHYAHALELLWRAEAIKEKTIGPQHPQTATALINLGNAYHGLGDYAKELELHLRALDILETVDGLYHNLTVDAIGAVARTYAAQGDLDRAVEYENRHEDVQEKNLELNLALGSEREKLAYLSATSWMIDRTISLSIRQAPGDAAARELAAQVILRRKGRVLDAMSSNYAVLRQRLSGEDRGLLDELESTNSKLAGLALSGPGKTPAAEYRKQLVALEERRETLESGISARSAEFRAHSLPVEVEGVRAAIPVDAALIEFAVYFPIDPKAMDENEPSEDARYAAYVLHQREGVQCLDLGPVKEIDGALAALRQALRDGKRKDVTELARAVDHRIMQPIRPLIGDAKHLLVSPDGELNLIPFEALVDEWGHYLLERYSFTYLTSGRDLLRMQVPRESRSRPEVIADPFFGEPQIRLISQADPPKSTPFDRRRSVTTGKELSTVYFAPLPGTAEEARSIKALFPEAEVLSGQEATKAALKRLKAPSLLHIATHGFFLDDAAGDRASATGGTRAISAKEKIENPLLRAGLAFAGANLNRSGSGDGILTALEASNLNLWGTKVVTLSACETGVGEVKNGEGVYGLRRAFFLAGTETLVMSLWPVSDRVTREIMTAFYTGLKQGLGRGEALSQAQRAMLKRKDRQHPFYWASFIQSGEWKNLNGK